MPPQGSVPRPLHAKEYNFLDIEIKYGILQVSLVNYLMSRLNLDRIHRLLLWKQIKLLLLFFLFFHFAIILCVVDRRHTFKIIISILNVMHVYFIIILY